MSEVNEMIGASGADGINTMTRFFMALIFLLLPHVAQAASRAYDYAFPSIDGGELTLDSYKGKVILLVNTASQCGFTGQYEDLQAVWEMYRDRGLVVVGVPSNDFGSQEPGSNADIKNFCETNFNIDFPMTEKVVVVGDRAHPFYLWAREVLGESARPKWNFHKYLVGRDGALIDWFSSMTNPASGKMRRAIENALNESKPKMSLTPID
jgi:glutathione peroxidase